MLVICPTADYELYLGRNLLPPSGVLFEPTSKLLGLWEERDVRITLFPDVCSVWRHREVGRNDYADAFEGQLQRAAGNGHDIQLHLHPEWLRATPEGDGWRFQHKSGSLHDLGFDPDRSDGAPAVITRGVEYLENLLRPVDPSYRCIAFRAGGWILQPERALIKALVAAGIRIDATVIPGARLLRTDYTIDYRRVPPTTSWHVDPEVGLSRDSANKDHLLEVSIAAYRGRFPIWIHAVSQVRLRRRSEAYAEPDRGRPMVGMGEKHSPLGKIRRKYRKLSIPRVLDMADTHEAMLSIIRSYIKKYDCANEDHVVCMNGHPKDTYDIHLVELRRFLDVVAKRYRDRVRFDTLRNVAIRAGYLPKVYPH